MFPAKCSVLLPKSYDVKKIQKPIVYQYANDCEWVCDITTPRKLLFILLFI